MFGKTCIWGAAIAAVISVVGAAHADTIQFKFKAKGDAKGWIAVTDKWKIKDKAYRPLYKEMTIPLAVFSDSKFKDLEFAFEFRSVESEGVKQRNAASLIRGKFNSDEGTLSGYVGVVLAQNSETGSQAEGAIYRFDNYNIVEGGGGEGPKLICQDVFIPDQSSKGELSFKADGIKLKLSFNGKAICSIEDATYAKGEVGFVAIIPVPQLPLEITQATITTK
jgi:hypothetical protein